MDIRFMKKIVKKRIIFVIESLNLGGAEKSLVTLLNLLDYSKYEVDLLLFAQGGPFQELLPEEVTLLPIPDYFSYTSISWHSFCEKLKKPKALFAQLRYSLTLRLKKHTHIEKAALLWKYSQNCISELSEDYDVPLQEKFIQGRRILKSPECKEAFMYGEFKNILSLYKAVLHTRCFYIVWLFHQAIQLKHNIINEKNAK